mmetsp:Transcript_16131/g.29163  ORF Transcript_16131/g.29163 Transcript_16131/m.29163 type:complete len:314 (+) Transcript_16131:395-1336(+)
MVNTYVNQILDDPQINIKSVPDSMERIIYTSTVRLTLNTVYEVASWLHGTEVLGHRLVLGRPSTESSDVPKDEIKISDTHQINVNVLEAMAEDLLENKNTNQRWLPDIIEKEIYLNCIRIIFTIIDSIADSVAFHMCGHQLSISFTPLNEERARQLVEGHESNIAIDETALDIIVDQRMVKESRDASSVTDVTSYLPGYGRCISQGSSQNTMVDLLILGMFDDILSETELLILEDSIRIRLVPEKDYVSQFLTVASDKEKLKSVEKELVEMKSLEKQTRSMAIVLVFGSVARCLGGSSVPEQAVVVTFSSKNR